MTETLNYSGTLVITTCWCGIKQAVPEELYDKQLREHRDGRPQTSIYCPVGHTWIRSGEGEAARLQKQLARERASKDQVLAELEDQRRLRKKTERQLSAQRGATKRATRRAACGVCPYCKRSFASVRMQAHVRTKHPEHAGGTR